MRIKKISINSFRNIDSLVFEPGEGFNFLMGRNAQGKSNFLEALYSLSMGRSYRTSREEDVIGFEDPFCRIEGCFSDLSGEFSLEVTWEKTPEKETRKTVKFNSNVLSRLVEFIDKAPMVLMTIDDLELVRGVPDRRRKFLDLLCSRLYPPYVGLLREYRKILDARNHWLKLPPSKQDSFLGEIYLEKFQDLGSDIIRHRLHTLESLEPIMRDLYVSIFGIQMPGIKYRSSIKNITETTKEEILKAYRETMNRFAAFEKQTGFTMVGPHRDDFDLKYKEKSMKNFASLGEMRTVAVILKLAEMEAIALKTGRDPVVCADDCFHEFDPERTAMFLDYLSTGRQVFYTATDFTPAFQNIPDLSVCRVSEGTITPCSLFQLKAY
jgi:DNA replication and repair protein RecF